MNQAIAANVSNRIRWQNHWHVVRQSWAFFQNDFAGRIANRVMQTGPAMRESLVALLTGVWYILVYGTSALILLASADRWLALPVVLWFAGYIVMLRFFVPRMRDRSKDRVGGALDADRPHRRHLHQHPHGEAVRARQATRTPMCARRSTSTPAVPRVAAAQHAVQRHACRRSTPCWSPAPARFAIVLWAHGQIEVGTVAMALPLVMADRQRLRLGGLAGHRHLREHRRGAGRHDDHRPADHADRQRRTPRRSTSRAARSRFEDVRFGYGRAERPDRRAHASTVKPGEKIGLVGRSGAGKSTLVNLLLRFFDLEGGRILIDGQDIADVTQESLRAQISVVTQDTSLLHRSIRDNIRYGQPGRDRRRDRRRGQARACARVHPRARGLARPARLRRPCRRARRQALRRPAPAHRHRARDPQGRADPGARRGDLRARQRGRGRDPGEPRHADGAARP